MDLLSRPIQERIKEGEALFLEGKLAESELVFLNLLKDHPSNADILNNLGAVAHGLAKYEEAEEFFVKALEIDKDHADAAINLATLLQNGEHWEDSARTLEKTPEEDPRLAQPYKQARHPVNLIEESNLKMAVLCLPGLESFLGDLTASLSKIYHVRTCFSTQAQDIEAIIRWADIVWLEWANEMAVHVTTTVKGLNHKKVFCRLHGYEVFTDHPKKINWEVVDTLVFVAKHKQEIFNKHFPGVAAEQVIIRNGINTDLFNISKDKINTKKLLLLGHLNYRKGLPLLIQFYHELLKRDPAFHLHIRGNWQDPRYKMAIETMVSELGLLGKITFHDEWIEDLNAWMADKSHILSFSLEESFHYAIGNGMAAGLMPVIHAWKESREIWPEEFIFKDLEQFLTIIQKNRFDPELYRKKVFDLGLDYRMQIEAVQRLVSKKGERDPALQMQSGATYSRKPSIHRTIRTQLHERKAHIFIIGLRRSGTTIFWETFRQDKRFICFDEPFRPHLRRHVEGGYNDKKKTMDEYFVYPEIIKKHWSQIQPYEECLPDFVGHQQEYLRALLKTAPHVCIDFVRCHKKIEALRELAPDALMIHLVRDPRAFVTSHLKPYGKWTSAQLPNKFFEYDQWFDFWQYQTLSDIIGLKGYAHQKLLELWKMFTDFVEAQEPDITIQFEKFATNPEAHIKIIYNYLDMEYLPLDFSKIHPPNPPYLATDTAWCDELDRLDIHESYVYQGFIET